MSKKYRLRIYAKGTKTVREIVVSSYDYAIERFIHYRDKWKLFDFATMAYFDGTAWDEIPIPEQICVDTVM